MTASIAPIARDNLTTRVYEELRRAMMEGRFWPGHRFKIRDLAASLQVSETPVREALMQLVREKGLRWGGPLDHRRQLSLAQYLECAASACISKAWRAPRRRRASSRAR